MALTPLPGATAGDDILTGTIGDDLIDALGGNDTVDSDLGADDVTLGDGMDIYKGLLTSFDTDTVRDFSTEDTIIFSNEIITSADFSFAPATDTFTVTGGAGAVFMMENIPAGYTFMPIRAFPNTEFTLQLNMLALSESVDVDFADRNGQIFNDFFIASSHQFSVSIKDTAVADFNNTLGTYRVTTGGLIESVVIIAEDVKTYATGGADFGTTFTIPGFTFSGDITAFFIVADGATKIAEHTGETFTFTDDAGDPWTTASADDPVLRANDVIVADVLIFHSYLNTMNFGDVTSAVSGVNTDGSGMTIGFEDSGNGLDSDFNDVVFDVTNQFFIT